MRDRRRLLDAQDLEAVEIVLFDAPVLEADLAVFGEAQPHYRGAFHLRVDAFRVGGETTIDRSINAGHREAPLVVHSDLNDGRDIADETAVYGDALAVPRRQFLAPLGFVRDELDDAPQTCRVDWESLQRIAVIRVIGRRFHEPRRPQKLEQHILGVAPRRVCELGNKRLNRKSMRDVRYRSKPADSRMRFGFADLASQVGNIERQVEDPLTELTSLLEFRIRDKGGPDRRRDGPVTPRDDLALRIEAGID